MNKSAIIVCAILLFINIAAWVVAGITNNPDYVIITASAFLGATVTMLFFSLITIGVDWICIVSTNIRRTKKKEKRNEIR